MVRFWNETPSEVKKGDTIAVWFSCGAASAMAAKKTIELYGDVATIRLVNNPVIEEHEDNLRFLDDVERWLGVKVERSVNPNYPRCSAVDVWTQYKYMSGPKWAPCTFELKKNARLAWEQDHKPDWHVLGFTFEEKRRADRFILGERSNMIPVLVNTRMTKQTCMRALVKAGIKPPAIYGYGFPNANCIGCCKASSPTYWNHVRMKFPDIFQARCELSRWSGDKLVKWKNERIYLDTLPKDAFGKSMKDLSFECGIFCEER